MILIPVVATSMVGFLLVFMSLTQKSIAYADAPPFSDLNVSATGDSPVGIYDCLEYEWGLIWMHEMIVLLENGVSLYPYSSYYPTVRQGTWGYTSTTQVITLTNFLWESVSYQPPDHLWASRIISDFEIAISCSKHAETVNLQIVNLSPEPSEVGDPVSITVNAMSTLGTPEGYVIVAASTSEICTGILVDGVGTCTITFATPGPRTLTAVYAGSENFPGGISLEIPHSVSAPSYKLFMPIILQE